MEKRKRYLLTVLWLAGMLLSVRGLMASDISLLAAMLVGAVVSGARLAAEKNPKTEEYVRRGIYLGSLVCFALTVSMLAQEMLLLVNQVTQLWNHRFGTTLGQFQVGDSAWIRSVLMWGLLAVPLVSFVAAQIRQRKQWGRFLLSTIALAAGSVLSGKTMWLGVCVLLLAVVKTFLYYSVPDRKPGRYNVGSTVLALVILAGIFGLTGGYQRMAALENWKQGVKDGVEKFRYGRDTLPKGNLSKAAGLQHGEEERLQIHMDTLQELYLRGFVGGTYTGTSWEPVDASAYQGEYEGMLQWLETENFSPLSQYDRYEELTRNNQEQSLTRTEVTVKNTGTYRKYMYLPTTVSEWRMQTCLNTAPASLPKGEDYLTWFLTEEQEGNAVAYAAAAVLAYRVAGDPARYVEGYHLAEQEKNDAVLTSQSAHAWAEVYVSGEGWLPVEVVPGMYTETYTNQMVEGKPAYQVGTSRQDDGLQAAEGTGNGSSKKEEPEEDKDLPGLLANIVLVILYGGFFLYLLLELQRAIRVQIHRRQKEMENGEIAEYYVNAFRELAAVAGVRTEEMTSSEQFFDAIRKHFPEVPERWYRRSMEILQRAKFGGKKLAPYEIYTLDCFEEKSHRMVYKKQNVGGKLWIRYGLCVEK
ncbi:transglutaminase-like domain-containing protein [Blautia sp.]